MDGRKSEGDSSGRWIRGKMDDGVREEEEGRV